MNLEPPARRLTILLLFSLILLLLLPLSMIRLQEGRLAKKEQKGLQEAEMEVKVIRKKLGRCEKEREEKEKLVVEVVVEIEEMRKRNTGIDLALEECKEDLANQTKVGGF